MIIDNGTKVHLVIDGVYEGDAGFARGEVAFVPNRFTNAPGSVGAGLMDGVAVKLTLTSQAGICVARVEKFG